MKFGDDAFKTIQPWMRRKNLHGGDMYWNILTRIDCKYIKAIFSLHFVQMHCILFHFTSICANDCIHSKQQTANAIDIGMKKAHRKYKCISYRFHIKMNILSAWNSLERTYSPYFYNSCFTRNAVQCSIPKWHIWDKSRPIKYKYKNE